MSRGPGAAQRFVVAYLARLEFEQWATLQSIASARAQRPDGPAAAAYSLANHAATAVQPVDDSGYESVRRAVAVLVRDGALERRRSPVDGRGWEVRIAADSQELTRHAMAEAKRALGEIVAARLSKQDRRRVERLASGGATIGQGIELIASYLNVNKNELRDLVVHHIAATKDGAEL